MTLSNKIPRFDSDLMTQWHQWYPVHSQWYINMSTYPLQCLYMFVAFLSLNFHINNANDTRHTVHFIHICRPIVFRCSLYTSVDLLSLFVLYISMSTYRLYLSTIYVCRPIVFRCWLYTSVDLSYFNVHYKPLSTYCLLMFIIYLCRHFVFKCSLYIPLLTYPL